MTHDAPGVSRKVLRATPEGLRSGVKRGLRRYGMVTARARPLPEFLIIGTKRGGTTSLLRYLQSHPDVAPLFPSVQHLKGVHYFDRRFDRGQGWYRSHFPSRAAREAHRLRSGRSLASGEASPYYLIHPHAAARAAQLVGSAKLIVLLRDPIERALSHYRDEVALGREPLEFRAAIAAEAERLEPELSRMSEDPGYYSALHEHASYVGYGRYGTHLARWLAVFPREQVLAIASERLFADPRSVLIEVLGFLGLVSHRVDTSVRFNAARGLPIDEGVREELVPLFREEVVRAQEMLGLELPWAATYSPDTDGATMRTGDVSS